MIDCLQIGPETGSHTIIFTLSPHAASPALPAHAREGGFYTFTWSLTQSLKKAEV